MANRKITLLAAIAAASISATDVVPVVDADAGTPTTYKATMAVLRSGLLKAPGTGWDTADYLTLGGGTPPASGLIRASHGAITADSPVLSSRVTWNAGGVTFRHLLFDVTDTASATGSLLADFQVGGTSKWKVDKTGAMTAASSIVSLGGATWTTVPWLKAFGVPNTGAIEFGVDRPAGNVSWLLGSSAATLTLGTTTQRDASAPVTAVATFTTSSITINSSSVSPAAPNTGSIGTSASYWSAGYFGSGGVSTDALNPRGSNTSIAVNTGLVVIGALLQQGGTVARFENTGGPATGAGPGVELGVAAGLCYIQCYNRTTAAFAPAQYAASSHAFNAVVSLGAATVAGAGTGDLVLPNAKSVRGANAANTATVGLIQRNAAGLVLIDADSVGAIVAGPLLYVAGAAPGTAPTSGVVLPNGAYFRGVNGAGTLATSLIGNKPGSDRVFIDPSFVGTEIFGDLFLTNLGGGTHQVSVGVADSGGVGFKLLRVPN